MRSSIELFDELVDLEQSVAGSVVFPARESPANLDDGLKPNRIGECRTLKKQLRSRQEMEDNHTP